MHSIDDGVVVRVVVVRVVVVRVVVVVVLDVDVDVVVVEVDVDVDVAGETVVDVMIAVGNVGGGGGWQVWVSVHRELYFQHKSRSGLGP